MVGRDCGGWPSSCGCVAVGGLSRAAASLWLRVGSASERASTGAVGLASGGSAGRGHDSPSARDPRTILPSRGPCHAKEESLPIRRAPAPRRTQDSAFVRRTPNDAAFRTGSRSERSILRPLTHERRILRHPQPRSESPPEPQPIRRSRPFRSAGPLAPTATQPQGTTQPEQRSSRTTTTHPQQRSSERRLRRGRSARRAGGREPACRPAPPRPCPPRAARRRTRRRRGPRRGRASPAPRSR